MKVAITLLSGPPENVESTICVYNISYRSNGRHLAVCTFQACFIYCPLHKKKRDKTNLRRSIANVSLQRTTVYINLIFYSKFGNIWFHRPLHTAAVQYQKLVNRLARDFLAGDRALLYYVSTHT